MYNKRFNLIILLFLSSLVVVCPSFTMAYTTQNKNVRPFNPRIDDYIHDKMLQYFIPSVATAVVRNDSILWVKGFGINNDPQTIYMTGSVTKTFTATAIFQIYEQGLIQLNDDVNLYLPFSLRHPNYTSTPITIEMLLTHYSGISKDTYLYESGMAEDGLNRLGMENPYEWLPHPYWIEEHLTTNGSLYIPEAWTPYEPGTTRHYSNIGYNVLGYILELVTGKPIWEYVQENIFDPLEMHSTSYNFTKFADYQLARPWIYRFEVDPTSTGNKAYPHYNFLGYSSGGIRSNVYDLARFLLVHLHNGISKGVRILEETTIQLMHQMQASWIDGKAGLVDWSGWGGTEGDIYGFHAKAYGIYDDTVTVPYAVITLINQGYDDARGACFEITSKLQDYVHIYDAGFPNSLNDYVSIILISSFPVLLGVTLILIFGLNQKRIRN
ncbi:MAG: serine hydrolase domain-containing protein [Candidatus Hermodarchaeota archaeon]